MSDKVLTKVSWPVKHRPTKFNQVVGQDVAIQKLRGMIRDKSLPSALLFIGNSGTGKTTLARMFAQYLNCETMKACGTCVSCSHTVHPDYKEMNAADSRGIDDIRSLMQFAKFRPRHNVRTIVLDECHALTTQAFQAALKTLEDAPPQTLFILATTNPEKIPDTILGRCNTVELASPSAEDIVKRLSAVAEAEKLAYLDDGMLKVIADASGGHVRDAIAHLESVKYYVSGCGGVDKVKDMKAAINEVVRTSSVQDSLVAIKVLMGLYLGKAKLVHNALLDSSNLLQVMNKAVYFSQYLIDTSLFEGRSNQIWHTPDNRKLKALWDSKVKDKSMSLLLDVHQAIINARLEMQNFAMAERPLLTARLCAFRKP